MRLWKKIKQYWAYIISLILLAVVTYLSLYYPNISRWWFVCILFFSIIISFIDKMKDDSEFDRVVNKLTRNINKNNSSNEEMKLILDKQIKMNKEWKEKKEVSLNLLNTLMDKGLIDREEIHKPFNNSEIFALYCFPTTHQLKKDNKIVHKMGDRLYPEFLQSLGFIRLHLRKGLFYIISKDRLTNELQDTYELKRHILEKVNDIIKIEWNNYLESIRTSHSKYVKSTYQEMSNLDYRDVLKFNILLMDTDISENNIGYLNDRRAFSNQFNNYLKQQIDLTKINVKKDVKGRILDLVNSISFELFFFGERKANLDKLKQKEQEIKASLNIRKWEDYLYKNDNDIANEISKAGFPSIKSLEYARLLKQRVREYSKALKELGISF